MPSNSQGEFEQINGAWIHPGAKIGENVSIGLGAIIHDQVTIGDDCFIGEYAIIKGPTVIGSKNKIYSHAVIGEAPQDLSYQGEPTRLEIGDNNVIREHVTINRGSVKGGGLTKVGSHNFLMIASHIAHDVQMGNHVIIANAVLIAGHCHVQDYVNMSGGVAIGQFITVGRHAFLGGMTASSKDIEPFMIHSGHPASPKGVNKIGLQRAGVDEDAIQALKVAHRKIFAAKERPVSLPKVKEEMTERGMLTPRVQELFDFIDRSRNGKFGRMIQTKE